MVQVGTHRELDPRRSETMGEGMRGTGGVGAHQHRPTSVIVGFAQVRGQLRQRGVEHLDVVSGGVGAGVARAQQPGQRLPGAARTVIGISQQRVEPEGPGRGLFFRMRGDQGGSRSITTFPSWIGAPARPQTRSRATARAEVIAPSAASTSPASVATSRDTVGSEATSPNTPGWAHSTATSAAQSPPSATATTRSSTILPGSWIANGRRQGRSRHDSSRDSPAPRAVAISSDPPACETNDSPPTITDNHGRRCLSFTCEVPLIPV